LQQSTSLTSESNLFKCAEYGGLISDSNKQSINLEGFQPILTLDMLPTSKSIKHNNALKNNNFYNNNISNNSNIRCSNKNQNRDLLGQAERGKIGTNSSSECSSNSSVEASVESNVGLISHEKKGNLLATGFLIYEINYSFLSFRSTPSEFSIFVRSER